MKLSFANLAFLSLINAHVTTNPVAGMMAFLRLDKTYVSFDLQNGTLVCNARLLSSDDALPANSLNKVPKETRRNQAAFFKHYPVFVSSISQPDPKKINYLRNIVLVQSKGNKVAVEAVYDPRSANLTVNCPAHRNWNTFYNNKIHMEWV